MNQMYGDWKGTEKTKLEKLDFNVMSEDDDPTDVDRHEPGTGEPGRDNAAPPEPVEGQCPPDSTDRKPSILTFLSSLVQVYSLPVLLYL
jgi:hypothetical protein